MSDEDEPSGAFSSLGETYAEGIRQGFTDMVPGLMADITVSMERARISAERREAGYGIALCGVCYEIIEQATVAEDGSPVYDSCPCGD